MITLRPATWADLPALETVLRACGLPSEDVRDRLGDLLVAEDDGDLAGVGGFERCGGDVALLRAFAVVAEKRNRGVGRQLYEATVAAARRAGISRLYLLTTTAQGYFARLGFEPVARSEAPEAIRHTRQFRELCPDAAALLFRSLADDGADGAGSAGPAAQSQALFDSGYYCAEAVLMTVADHNGIDSPLVPAIATGFCSGVSRTSGMCGALTGGILGLNLVYGRDRETESVEQNYRMVQRLVSEFRARCGSTECSELLGCDLGTAAGQQAFRAGQLHTRCREYTAVAATLAVGLSSPEG